VTEIDIQVFQPLGQAGTSWSVMVSNDEVKLHRGGHEPEHQTAMQKANEALKSLLKVVNDA
jgi:hypothetical protein